MGEFRGENPFSEVPQTSCIVWDTQGPFLRHVHFFDFRPAGQKPTKICRNGYLFPFPWRKQPRGPCPSQRAPDLKVHSQIESSVRPNGTPVMPLLHFGQVRLPSDRPYAADTMRIVQISKKASKWWYRDLCTTKSDPSFFSFTFPFC